MKMEVCTQKILEDHYDVGNVVALAIMEVKCSVD